MSQPHDRLIRYLAGHRQHAAALARLVLPPDIAALVDFGGLRVEPGRHLDPELRERIVDLLFHLPFADGGSAWLDLIFEHQSQSDRWMPLRIHDALGQRWTHWQREHPDAETLPMVFTVVLSHDPAGWRAATNVAALIALTPAQRQSCARFMPSTPYHVFDLAAVSDDALRLGADAAMVELTMLCFKYARDVESLRRMITFRAGLITATSRATDGREAIIALLRYLAQVIRSDARERGIYTTIVQAIDPALAEGIEMTNFEEFVEAFGPNWRRDFQRQNITQARRDTLTRQLQRRFDLSELPAWLAARVETAELETLDEAEMRILFAERPEDVFPAD